MIISIDDLYQRTAERGLPLSACSPGRSFREMSIFSHLPSRVSVIAVIVLIIIVIIVFPISLSLVTYVLQDQGLIKRYREHQETEALVRKEWDTAPTRRVAQEESSLLPNTCPSYLSRMISGSLANPITLRSWPGGGRGQCPPFPSIPAANCTSSSTASSTYSST
ncbi:hypothetical protein M378DRAFT_921235 [Amanita muscaria Koide BX008]|uniref:Uncharacterized protein n=1 Tax=Amanita muscaria (strain Koide BX008) TaxID=946122 RepID=A0A0C2WUI7_AMAMK|nr:hypothetical protein M378DRAFT_921235 [Amanita muscaria Koide BX008]